MSLLLDGINLLGILCTIYGSYIGQHQNVNARRLNQAYLCGCLCFLIFFGSQGLWANVGLYIVLGIFAIRGIQNHRSKIQNLNITDKEWELK
jgi:hypothetical protein